MKRIIVITIAIIFSLGCVSLASATSKKEIINDLTNVVYQGSDEIGLNDLDRKKTKIVDLRIMDIGNGEYCAMAEFRLYSKEWGEYHAVSYTKKMNSDSVDMYGIATYIHNAGVEEYELTKTRFTRFTGNNQLVLR